MVLIDQQTGEQFEVDKEELRRVPMEDTTPQPPTGLPAGGPGVTPAR